jgi:hypothetical protein
MTARQRSLEIRRIVARLKVLRAIRDKFGLKIRGWKTGK